MAHDNVESTREFVTPPVPEATLGALIAGRYKLLEQIGEGGMGLVWMAEQREPVRRLVAVKLIKAGMDSRAVLARFEAERQALAIMDHPSIARVLDGGVTDRGHPWFAMELVRGLPVTEYCDQRRMSVADRLALFNQVCSAVQHAHQKGIIHRDLKPSNVLVTEHDGHPLPKIIDFGLAKALGGGTMLTDRTLYTAFGTAAGTPLYMAPEQVAINALDIDTRADVYALGVLLYELLTGTTPLERGRIKEVAWEEVRRAIREEEPPRPSMRISSSAALPTLAATRQIEPARLAGLVRGDLDWIVLKALEKDRNRRYESAAALAADVQRHLVNEPVMAAPPTLSYRARKFIRKNRGPVIAAAAVAAALVLGIIGTTTMTIQYRAVSAREAARANIEASARDAAELDAYIANIGSAQTALAASAYAEARQRLDAAPASRRGWEWKFLREQAASAVAEIPTRYEVRQFTPDGSRVILSTPRDSETSDGVVEIWNLSGRPVAQPIKTGDGYVSLGLNSARQELLTASADGVIGLWDLAGRPVREPFSTGQQWENVIVSPDGERILSRTPEQEAVAMLWEDGGRSSVALPIRDVRQGWRFGMYWLPNGNHFVTFHVNASQQLWDVHGRPAGSQISPKRILHAANLYENESRQIADLSDGAENVTTHFSPDGALVSATTKSKARLWDLDGHPVSELIDASEASFSPEGTHWMTHSKNTVRIWDVTKRPIVETATITDPANESVNFSSDGKLVIGWSDTALRIWDLRGNPASKSLHPGSHSNETDSEEFRWPAISLDGSRVATFGDLIQLQSSDGRVLGTRQPTGFGGPKSDPYVRFTPDARYMLLSFEDSEWGTPAAPTLIVMAADFDSPRKLLWPNWGEALDRAYYQFQIEAAKLSSSEPATRSSVRHQRKIRTSDDGTVELLDERDRVLHRLQASHGPVSAAAISADGQRLVTSGKHDSAVRFWETNSWQEVTTIHVPLGVESLEFSPDDSRLIVTRLDGGVEIWDGRSSADRSRDMDALFARVETDKSRMDSYVGELLKRPGSIDTVKRHIDDDPALRGPQSTLAEAVVAEQLEKIDAGNRPDDHVWAQKFVDSLLQEPFTEDSVKKQLVNDRALNPIQRVVASKVLSERLKELDVRGEDAWEIVAKPGRSTQEIETALTDAARAAALWPTDSNLKSVAVAHYRLGHFQEALDILVRIDDPLSQRTPLFKAMAHYQLGDVEKARELLAQAEALRENGGLVTEDHAYYFKEAEALIGWPPPSDKPTSKPNGTIESSAAQP
jgi:WD40 repeat protein